MKIGFGLPVSGAWATPGNISSFATRAEAAGYSSLWTFQRLIVPDGSAMDPVYQSVLDPMAAMAFAAAVTKSIRLGVAVVNLPFVSPIYHSNPELPSVLLPLWNMGNSFTPYRSHHSDFPNSQLPLYTIGFPQ